MTHTAGPAPARVPAHREGWQVGTLLGVPVVLARSLLVVAAVITFVVARVVSASSPGLGAAAYLVALGFTVLLLLSVLVHELAHAAAARAVGTPARQIVLNLWGGHTQFDAEAATPGRSSLIAVVGPLANVAIAAGALLMVPVTGGGLASDLLLWLAYANGLVAAFNLVPGLPLDGGRVLEALVWKLTGDRSSGMVAAGWVGRGFALVVIWWVVVRPLVAGTDPDLISIIWAAMIGALLWQGAGEAIRAAGVRRRVRGAAASALAAPAVAVPEQVTVAEATAVAALPEAPEVVLLGGDGVPSGLLDRGAVSAVPVGRRDVVPALAVATPLPRGAVLHVSLSGEALMSALATLPGQEWVVVDDDGRVVGLLRSTSVLNALLPSRR